MIKKYRKKPLVIEAIQFTGDNHSECRQFIENNYDKKTRYPNMKTLEGIMEVSKNDYIIKGIKGEFYPCKPDVFEATYEQVDEDDK